MHYKNEDFFFQLTKDLPDPATPTVAAPAPINLAAESISRVTGDVWKDLICGNNAIGVVFWAAND